jgi:oligosaccharide repeat unit polymerase
MQNKFGTYSVTRLAALSFAAFITLALIRPVLADSRTPFVGPLMVATLCAGLLFFIRARKEEAAQQFMRVGFYLGILAFFLSFPILSPEKLNPDIPDEIHNLLAWALFLTICGFELMYQILPTSKSVKQSAPHIEVTEGQRRWLYGFVFVGMGAWFLSVWDYASALNAPIASVILTMRGVIEGSQSETVASPGYLVLALGTGVFLSASAGSLLLTFRQLTIRGVLVCWGAVIGCAAVGFLSGSRAVFLYSFVPLSVVIWTRLSRLRLGKVYKWIGAISAIVLVVAVWGAMTAMRGADIRNYEGGIEEMSPVITAQEAFDVYSTTAVVVESFPQKIPYAYGESMVPLVLGWVPRTVWPDKPYPFGIYMNTLNGETLQARAASIAVGLTGEGYGNFGLTGAFLWGAILGLACRQGDRYIARMHQGNPLRLQIAGMAVVWVSMIVRGGVPEMFYMGLQIIVVPVALAKFLTLRRKQQLLVRKPEIHSGITALSNR